MSGGTCSADWTGRASASAVLVETAKTDGILSSVFMAKVTPRVKWASVSGVATKRTKEKTTL